jgi:hypothetical protein
MESDEQYDEVILSDENPDEVRKNQERQNLDDIKNSLTADAQDEEYADEEYIEEQNQGEQGEEEYEEYQKEENYNELTEKISQILDAKLSSFTQMQHKKEDTISDLVKAELPRILKNWVQNNEELIINIVEKVVERQISEAISKIKK